jgi:hypothetical protein
MRSFLIGHTSVFIEEFSSFSKDRTPEIVGFIQSSISTKLPWFFKVPVTIYINALALLCFIITLKRFDKVSIENRKRIAKYFLVYLPMWSSMSKLINGLIILKSMDYYQID